MLPEHEPCWVSSTILRTLIVIHYRFVCDMTSVTATCPPKLTRKQMRPSWPTQDDAPVSLANSSSRHRAPARRCRSTDSLAVSLCSASQMKTLMMMMTMMIACVRMPQARAAVAVAGEHHAVASNCYWDRCAIVVCECYVFTKVKIRCLQCFRARGHMLGEEEPVEVRHIYAEYSHSRHDSYEWYWALRLEWPGAG